MWSCQQHMKFDMILGFPRASDFCSGGSGYENGDFPVSRDHPRGPQEEMVAYESGLSYQPLHIN